MKKILFVFALMCAVLNVSAQEDSKWNLKFGAGLSTLAGSDADLEKYALSYKVGLGYEFGISEKFAIEPALMLSNKSLKEEGVEGTINRIYAEIPIMAAYTIALNDDMKIIINAGPYVAYGLLGSDIEIYGEGSHNAFDVCERFEAGVQAGVKFAFGNLSIGADFSRAFTKSIEDAEVYTQGFGLTFGYNF